jgi:Spy/CpxP family protein refolding chaperone
MSKSRLCFIFSLILVFAAGVVAGVFAERRWFAKETGGRPSGRGPVPSHDRWAKELGLTAEQKSKIQDIFKKNDERMKELRTDYFKHLSEIRDQLRKEIDEVLTPEQRKKQAEMIQRARDQHRKEMDRRPPSPGPRPQNNPQEKPSKERPNEKENDPRSGDYRDRRGSHPGLFPD